MISDYDVLIAGTGLAGLYTALNLNDNLKVLLICKGELEECNSYLAQGGITVARNDDDIDLFIKDTLVAGGYENDLDALNILAKESRTNINQLVKLGVEFDRDDNGDFQFTKEGAHSINRIIHFEDHTGEEVIKVLIKDLKTRNNITVLENSRLLNIINHNNNCLGGIIEKDGTLLTIHSKTTVLATGGIGGLFKNSTNFKSTTGDGLSIALKNNIKLKDLAYIQIHPTALYDKENKERRFLISESMRGEGAILTNCLGERFTDELLPRDILTEAILKEEEKTNCPYVYLDISFKEKEYIKKRFPAIYEECKKRGLDITKRPIPVTPAQHYLMGGIEVDTHSRTSMTNLFATGEVSCTGIHGKNRLASNSLLESLVFSKRAAETINKQIANIDLIIDHAAEKLALETAYQNDQQILINKLITISEEIKNELVDY